MTMQVSDARKNRLRALAAAHDAWVAKHIATAPFDGSDRPEGSDYNLHYVDLEASDEAQLEWMETSGAIMGRTFT